MRTSRKRVLLPLLLPLVAGMLAGCGSEPVALKEIGSAHTSSGNLTWTCDWNPEEGLGLRFSQASGSRTNSLFLSSDRCELGANQAHPLPRRWKEAARFFPENLPNDKKEDLETVLRVRAAEWTLHLDGKLVARLPALAPAPFIVSGHDGKSGEEESPARFQRVAPFRFEDRFMVAEGEENPLSNWEQVQGKWSLHSVDLDMRHDKWARHRAGRTVEAARSPNFYSITGTGTNALIIAGYPFYDSYEVEAAVRVDSGVMGIVFYADYENFFAFTAERAHEDSQTRFVLWETRDGTISNRTALAAVRAPVTERQWVKLKVRALPDRVTCSVDGTTVIEQPLDLPPGGTFGLFATENHAVMFDDFAAHSLQDLQLDDWHDVSRYTLFEKGRLLPSSKALGLLPARYDRREIEVRTRQEPATLVIGSPTDSPHRFSADVKPDSGKPTTISLLCGWTSPTASHYRVTCRFDGATERYSIEKVTTNGVEAVDNSTYLPHMFEQTARPAPLTITCDATEPDGLLRCERNGELVLLHQLTAPPMGASGIRVPPGNRVSLANLRYEFDPREKYQSKYEKNRIFVTDPFMRHWSSPEGEWITFKDGDTWHKSDFFGDFQLRMPAPTGSAVHLGVREGERDGAYVVKVGETDLELRKGAGADTNSPPMATVPLEQLTADETGMRWYTVRSEDRWLVIGTGGKILLKRRIPARHAGSRIRIEGFTTEQLKHSHVERHHVKDSLFNESLHAWTVNGGNWAVVNRFMCDPRWSHMSGISDEGLAALWSKLWLKGDFCVEVYAGMRHGWYDRPGDLNLTIMNRETTPGQGYTLTCTGWDPDHSQRLTRLYRNGELLAESDKYLVPRVREGSKRRGYVPLVHHENRDIHGAWYYLKFRRRGKTLEFHFDNEEVFRIEDEDAIKEGSMGFWTFMNGIMVARIKVAAEEIGERPLPFEPAPLSPLPSHVTPPHTDLPGVVSVTKESAPVDLCMTDGWRIEDDVSRSRLQRLHFSRAPSCLVVSNLLGSGSMELRCPAPVVPLNEIAGWRLYVKQTPDTRFNIHFSTGAMKGGKYEPKRHFFQHISGTAFSKGKFMMVGSTPVPDTEIAQGGLAKWCAGEDWTPVDVWVPRHAFAESRPERVMVRFEGFGNLQPSYILQGLHGNAPGSIFAVRQLSEIRYGKPTIRFPSGVAGVDVSIFARGRRRHPLISTTNEVAIQEWIERVKTEGLVDTRLTSRVRGVNESCDLLWIQLPQEPEVKADWHPTLPETVKVSCPARYPDPRMVIRKAEINGVKSEIVPDGLNAYRLAVPQTPECTPAKTNTLGIVVEGEISRDIRLPWTKSVKRHPPVLVEVDGLDPLFLPFQRNEDMDPPVALTAKTQFPWEMDNGNRFLRIENGGRLNRLKAYINAREDLAHAPLLQFRYRADPMAQISLDLGDSMVVHLAEEGAKALDVALASPFLRDEKWHTWIGKASDAFRSKEDFSLRIRRLFFGSFASTDQTGRFSFLDIDDMVLGPAIGKAEQLHLTPRYHSSSSNVQVEYALMADAPPCDARPADEIAALTWRPAEDDGSIRPTFNDQSDGVHHLLLRARDAANRTSTVTDIPFLLDREAPHLVHRFTPAKEPECNDTLLTLSTPRKENGAPLLIDELELAWGETPIEFDPYGSKYTRATVGEVLRLNWPYLCRDQIATLKDGQTANIVIGNIKDGAGNQAPDCRVPITLDFKADKTPPTLLPFSCPSNVAWCAQWEDTAFRDRRKGGRRLAVSDHHKISWQYPKDEQPYLSTKTLKDQVAITQSFSDNPWSALKYPMLAMRLRRPNMKQGDKTVLTLSISLRGVGPVYLLLAGSLNPEKMAKVKTLPTPIDWQPDTWHDISLDLRDLIPEQHTESRRRRISVSSISIRMSDAAAGQALHVQSALAYAPWSPGDRLRVNAFDASGIDCISYKLEPAGGEPLDQGNWKKQAEPTLEPATLKSAAAGHPWIVIRAWDRAGNASVPMRLPAPQSSP